MATTVDRVLPWRRHSVPAAVEIKPLIDTFRRRHPKTSTALIARAYDRAAAAHEGQFRKSGDQYVTHPLAVATIVADLGLDEDTVAAALLHDAVEDTRVGLDDLRDEFNPVVASIVDGVTKLERLDFDSKEAQQAATIRKMLVAVAEDLRVLIIKLSDRLHNMRTIAAMPEWKQERTARETLDVYAPLAHRFGMQDMKQQLEDLAFAALHPKRYAEIDHMVATRSPERELYLTQVLEEVRQRMVELGVDAEVTGRPKHLWSIYEKMVVKGREFDDIFDLLGIRVIVETVKDCYAAVGSIHGTWHPVQGRFKDYVAMPKFNLYQSLHTTVIGPQGKPLEVQIRTREMHSRAEIGVAAHWTYKDPSPTGDAVWLNRILDWDEETSDPTAFMANLKVDLDQDEVYVFTPKGAVITLPNGSTPIDFAYTIHTEVGHACIGAKVDGRLVALESALHSGATVEIFTGKPGSSAPSRDWLQVVATRRAATRFASGSRRSGGRTPSRPAARRCCGRCAARGCRSAPHRQPTCSPTSSRASTTSIPMPSTPPSASTTSRPRRSWPGPVDCSTGAIRPAKEQLPTTVRRPRRAADGAGVHVEGLDDVMVRLSRCCTPVPGDEIMGFVTRGRGVSVHRHDCANVVSLVAGQSDRLIEVEWDRSHDGTFLASIEVKALDRKSLLGDVSSAFASFQVNILGSTTRTGNDRVCKMHFDFELGDPSHLDSIISSIKGIDSVYDAYRVLPGA